VAKVEDQMRIIFYPPSGQVTQLIYETTKHGSWTRISGEWRLLHEDDLSTVFLETRLISPAKFREARDYFDDSVLEKNLTYEPQYRMWYV
jgi:hypothetical protein